MEQAAHRGSEVIVPGGVQKTCSCGTEGHGLVSNIGGGWMVGLHDPEGPGSNLNDSMIL